MKFVPHVHYNLSEVHQAINVRWIICELKDNILRGLHPDAKCTDYFNDFITFWHRKKVEDGVCCKMQFSNINMIEDLDFVRFVLYKSEGDIVEYKEDIYELISKLSDKINAETFPIEYIDLYDRGPALVIKLDKKWLSFTGLISFITKSIRALIGIKSIINGTSPNKPQIDNICDFILNTWPNLPVNIDSNIPQDILNKYPICHFMPLTPALNRIFFKYMPYMPGLAESVDFSIIDAALNTTLAAAHGYGGCVYVSRTIASIEYDNAKGIPRPDVLGYTKLKSIVLSNQDR